MLRLALKNVKHNPRRLILTAIAVSLGVALVTATHVFTNALSSGFNALFEDIYDTTDIIVEVDPNGDLLVPPGTSPFTDADVESVGGVDGVAMAAGSIVFQMGMLLDEDGQAPNGGQGGPPTLVINWIGDEEMDGATLIEGEAPTGPGEVVVDVDSYANRDLEPGDTLQLASESGITTLTVTGSVRFGEDNATQTATLLWADTSTVRELAGVDGFDSVQAITDEGADNDAVAASIQEILPDGTRAITSQAKVQEETAALGQALRYVDIFTLAFAFIALFVGAYIIVNTFRIIVTQRTRELGLLRAIGMKGSQVRSMIMLEAAVIGLLASTLGIGLGWLLALGLTGLLELAVGNIFGAITLPADALIWGYGLGMLVTLVSALMPAIHAAAIAPMEALREAGTASNKPLRVRNIVGIAMVVLGAIAMGVGLYASLPRPYIYVGAGAVLLILGVTLLAAQVLVPLAYALRGALTKLFGVDGKLASNNIQREPRRSANTAAALMIGVTLLALAATFTQSLKVTITEAFGTSEAELFGISTGLPIPQGAVDEMLATDGVEWVAREAIATVTIDGEEETLWVVDAEYVDGLYPDAADRPFEEIEDGVFVSSGVETTGVAVGDELTITGAASEATLTVTGILGAGSGAGYAVAWETGVELMGDVDMVQVSIGLEEGADVAAVQEQLTEALATDYPLVQLQSTEELMSFANQFVDFFLNVITVMLGAALIIAVLGVANTLLLSVTERTREIGLLRAVGVKRASIWRMITLESVVMALFGTVLGMILGVSIGAALVLSLQDEGITGFAIPWLNLVLYTVIAAIAGVVAAIWPAWRASRLDILQAIAADG